MRWARAARGLVTRIDTDRQRAGRPADPPDADPAFPLDIVFCATCALVQLGHELPAERIFDEEYPVLLVVLGRALRRTRPLTSNGSSRNAGSGPSSLVVEVASNDGYLLRNVVAAGVPALGIDAAPGPAAAAEAIGVPTIVGFFGVEQRARRCGMLTGPPM